jgi:hypothetical protein
MWCWTRLSYVRRQALVDVARATGPDDDLTPYKAVRAELLGEAAALLAEARVT